MSERSYYPTCADCCRAAGKDASEATWQCHRHALDEIDRLRAVVARLQQEREGLIAPCMCCREVTQPCQHGCRCSVAPIETQEPTR